MSFITDNLVKILGSVTTSLSTLLAANAFEGLLSPPGIRIVNIINVLVGAALVAVGFNNTTKERVASAMETAIRAIPPSTGDQNAKTSP